MKNSECEIHIISNKNEWTQKYRKEGKGWIQNTNGVIRNMTPEQLLSHILPLLVNKKQKFHVVVIPDKNN